MIRTQAITSMVASLALCLIVPAAAQAGTRIPVKNFARHATLANPAISPDGKHLAISVHNDNGRYQLSVLELPGLKPISRLNMSPHDMPSNITWVDNTRLVMAVARETGSLNAPQGTGDIVAVDMDGSHKRILYSMHLRDKTKNHNVLAMPRGASAIAGLPHEPDGHLYIAVYPFSRHASFGSHDHGRSLLYDVDASNGASRLIGKIDQPGMTFVLHDDVARYAYGSDQADPYRIDVYYRAGKDQPWHRLSKDIGKVFVPLDISADGKRVYAMYSRRGGPNQLITSDLDGSHRKVLAGDSFSSVANVQWTPYPYKPFAVRFNTEKPHVQYLGNGIYAQIQQALQTKADAAGEVASIVDMSHDGTMLLINTHSDRDPGTFSLLDRRTMHLSPLFRPLPWIDPARMSHRKPIRFKASSGTELAGFLTLPKDSSGKDLPMILIPHGGPIGVADHWSYDPWSQFLANRGYAVLQVNYRGSGGRGGNFEHAGYRQFGTGIQQDLIDGVHWAIKQGIADPDRICIFGGSFGGYSALMAPIRAPGLFKCSVDYAGISDYAIEFNRSDTRRRASGRNYFNAAIGTDEATIKAISPIYHLDRFNIPVLIVHGKDDPRVPYKNATELRSALEKAGKPYQWLVRGKEQHGFYSEANNEALYKALEKFFGKYIGPAKAH